MLHKIPLLLSLTSAQQSTWEGGPTFDVSYDSASSKLKFDVAVPKDMWFGIAFKQSMADTDMVVFAGKGDTGEVTDYYSTSFAPPTADTV